MSSQRIFKTFNIVWCISFLLVLLLWSSNNFGCLAQDDMGMDDAGADTTGNDATNDMMDHDPNTVNPQKDSMSGNNSPIEIMDNLPGRSIELLLPII